MLIPVLCYSFTVDLQISDGEVVASVGFIRLTQIITKKKTQTIQNTFCFPLFFLPKKKILPPLQSSLTVNFLHFGISMTNDFQMNVEIEIEGD